MAYIDFMSAVHKSIKRDYLARVNDPEYPKAKAAAARQEMGYRLLGWGSEDQLRRLSLHAWALGKGGAGDGGCITA